MKLTKEKIFTKPILVVVIATFCCVLWGSAFPCVKIGYNYFNIGSDDIFSQMLFAGVRFLIAGILIVAFGSITEKKLLLPSKSSLPSIGVLSLTQTIIQYVFFYIALANTSGVNSSIINGSNNFFAIIIAFFLLREKLSVKKIAGCLLGFGGVILASISQGTVGGFNVLGEGFMIISAISCALSNVLLKKFSQKHNPLILSGYQFIFG
ncbi:MAG: DMT family transporter, partial [Clostridia bacterium]|nr:DMT family transporter [Clostridia bacterium]